MEKFLADESVDFRIVKFLRENGYEVIAIMELKPGITDEEILKMAVDMEAILLTEDKDFGELTFRLRKKNKGIVLTRMSGLPIEDKINKLKEVLKKHFEELKDRFTVITSKKVRIRNQNQN